MVTYGVYLPIYFITRKALFYIFVCSLIITSFMSTLVCILALSQMHVTHEICNCVLNFMLGQPDKVRSSPSKIAMFHHHG